MFMANNDPVTMEALENGPLLDYWFALNKKMSEIAKMKKPGK